MASDGLADKCMFWRSLKDDSLLLPVRKIDIIIIPPMDPMTIPNIKSIIPIPPLFSANEIITSVYTDEAMNMPLHSAGGKSLIICGI
jgi:hypothetical protein